MLTYPEIDPVIFSIGPLAIRWYGLMYVIGFVGGWILARRRSKESWSIVKPEQVDDLIGYLADELPEADVFTAFRYGSTFTGHRWPDQVASINGNTHGYPTTYLMDVAAAVSGSDPPRFDYLEGALDGREFFVGDAFSIADIAVGTQMAQLDLVAGTPDADRWPGLVRHTETMKARPGFVENLAACQKMLSRMLPEKVDLS